MCSQWSSCDNPLSQIMTPAEIEKLYCQQLVKHYDKLSMSGLPEPNPGLSEIPLAKVFVKLGIQIQEWSFDEDHSCISSDFNREKQVELPSQVCYNSGKIFTG